MSNRQQRRALVGQHIVFHLKVIELLHLMLLNLHLAKTKLAPENVMGHGTDRFRETLLGTVASMFGAVSDRNATDALAIWTQLYPTHAGAIKRVWERKITPGEYIMRRFRDQAGVHGDRPGKYFAAKMGLYRGEKEVLSALDAFYGLSACLLRRQQRELPQFASEVEAVLLDEELLFAKDEKFNRRWLRDMHLIESGPYTKKFF